MNKKRLKKLEEIEEGKFYYRPIPLMNHRYKTGNNYYITSIKQLPNSPGNDLNQRVIMFDVYDDNFNLIKREGLQAVIFESFIDKNQMYEIQFESKGEEAKWLMMLS